MQFIFEFNLILDIAPRAIDQDATEWLYSLSINQFRCEFILHNKSLSPSLLPIHTKTHTHADVSTQWMHVYLIRFQGRWVVKLVAIMTVNHYYEERCVGQKVIMRHYDMCESFEITQWYLILVQFAIIFLRAVIFMRANVSYTYLFLLLLLLFLIKHIKVPHTPHIEV